jgi:hypothetical protein
LCKKKLRQTKEKEQKSSTSSDGRKGLEENLFLSIIEYAPNRRSGKPYNDEKTKYPHLFSMSTNPNMVHPIILESSPVLPFLRGISGNGQYLSATGGHCQLMCKVVS